MALLWGPSESRERASSTILSFVEAAVGLPVDGCDGPVLLQTTSRLDVSEYW
jgi:hypothetical protein